jgi:hypothetical protein
VSSKLNFIFSSEVINLNLTFCYVISGTHIMLPSKSAESLYIMFTELGLTINDTANFVNRIQNWYQ